jgi:predicted TIM-barrel fold metal-dependent hydrolase
VIVDIHAHPGFGHDTKQLRKEFRPALQPAERYQVDWICLNALADWTESPEPAAVRRGNDAVLALMAEHPERVLGFCYVNPRHPVEALAEIERCVVKDGMAGIKLWLACKASDKRVDPIAQRAAELNVPILQHAWHNAKGRYPNESSPEDVAALAARHPRTMIVMAHLTGVGEQGIASVAPYDNVSVDISGGEPESWMVELAVRRLGAERVVFGTDTPIRSYGMTLGKVLGANLTARQRRLILGENARRLLARRLAG